MSEESKRIPDITWKKWGPYVSNREWGLVREDYSANGDAWNYNQSRFCGSKNVSLG